MQHVNDLVHQFGAFRPSGHLEPPQEAPKVRESRFRQDIGLWRYIAPALRELGHVVKTPTLTGLGERRHVGNRTATLSTHIEDIVAHIEMEDLQDMCLVSQSCGGVVATGTLTRIPDRIRSMIDS